MRITLFFLLLSITHVHAGKIDKSILKNLTGSKWELIEEKKEGEKKEKQLRQEQITFSTGSILFDAGEEHYQCNFTVKNEIEYWMYCAEPDQYIYKIHALNSSRLEIDVFAKTKDGKYVKRKRMTYRRKS
jgi:hypothetical protein